MWCYIKLENIDDYISQYSELLEYWENICLLKTKDSIFLPRLMFQTHPSQL